jgi:hypothetical protein
MSLAHAMESVPPWGMAAGVAEAVSVGAGTDSVGLGVAALGAGGLELAAVVAGAAVVEAGAAVVATGAAVVATGAGVVACGPGVVAWVAGAEDAGVLACPQALTRSAMAARTGPARRRRRPGFMTSPLLLRPAGHSPAAGNHRH